jgi:hypothetical protein
LLNVGVDWALADTACPTKLAAAKATIVRVIGSF